jgi:hypothetical protein
LTLVFVDGRTQILTHNKLICVLWSTFDLIVSID